MATSAIRGNAKKVMLQWGRTHNAGNALSSQRRGQPGSEKWNQSQFDPPIRYDRYLNGYRTFTLQAFDV